MSRLTKNIIYNIVGQALVVALSLLAVRAMFRVLGGEAVGIVFASITFAALLALSLDLGASTTAVRQVSAYADSDPVYVRRLVRMASLLYWGGTIVLVALFLTATPVLASEWIRPVQMDAATATQGLRLFGLAALAVLPRSLYVSVLRGLERMGTTNAIDVGVVAAQQIGTLAILELGGGLHDIGAWFVLCAALGIVAYVVVASRLLGWRSLVPGLALDVVRRNLPFASSMLVTSLTSAVNVQSGRVFASRILPLESFGFYALAARVVSTAALPTAAVAQAALPSFPALRDRKTALVRYRKLQDLVCLGTAPVFGFVSLFAGPLFAFVLNEGAAAELFLPTTLLCLGYFMNATLTVPYVYAIALDRPGIVTRWSVLALGLVPFTGVLVVAFGMVGAAASWIVYHLAAYALFVPRFCAECLGENARDWFAPVARVSLLAIATYGPALAFARALGPTDVGVALAAYLAAIVLFGVGAYRLAGSELRTSLQRAGDWLRRATPAR